MNTKQTPATLGVALFLLAAGGAEGLYAAPTREDGGEPAIERPLDMGRFTAIELRGVWKLQFTLASEYSAVLAGDPEVIEAIKVSTWREPAKSGST